MPKHLTKLDRRSGIAGPRRTMLLLGVATAALAVAQPARAQPASADQPCTTCPVQKEPWGPRSPAVPPAAPSSGANVQGSFGTPVSWPVVPIHVVLLPD